MSDSISPRSFDLAAVLSGRSYPEVEAPFYLDEVAALKLARRERLLNRLELLRDEEKAKEVAADVAALKQSVRDSRYVCHLRGIPSKLRQDLLKKATEKYPNERDFLGQVQENDDRDELYTNLLWHAMIERIESPDGAVQAGLTLEQVESIRGSLPHSALVAIQEGVSELLSGAKAGFESAVQDSDFLSQP